MKFKNIAAALLVPLNALLLFFLIVEGKLVIPAWLQVFGRMHPLVLHFPIVLILLYAAVLLLAPKAVKTENWYNTILQVLLLSSAFTAAATALMGLLLSREAGYDADTVVWHKYLGALTSFALFGLYSYRNQLQQKPVILNLCTGFTCIILLWGGHLGGDITHGNNFVLAPVTHDVKKFAVALEDAFVFNDLVMPIFEAKCLQCHNSSKSKGDLVMETKELLLKGGKDGKLWDVTQPDLGLLMKRIHLPLDEKEHMPPDGKTQLTESEIAILYAWIKTGANFDNKVLSLPEGDTLRVLAAKTLKQSADEQFDFAAASDKDIQKLNNNNRVITPLALGSPALAVTFYNKPFYNTKALEELKGIGNNITELNLDNMPVKDEDLQIIGGFTNLRKLVLNNTAITGATLSQLKNLANVKTISLSGTTVKADQLAALQPLPKLKHVYLWNTDVQEADAKKLAQKSNSIAWFTGFKGDNVILKLTTPTLQNEQTVITQPVKLQLKNYIRGASIRYTTDGKDPDSTASALYDTNVVINDNLTIKAKAFKPGWISSDIVEQHFFKSTYVADSAVLLTPTDAKYKGTGGKTLIDKEKSDLSFGNGKWLGYRDNDMQVLLLFNKPVKAQSITFSTLMNVSGYIFPPASVQVWGGMDAAHLTLLGTITPPQPTKDMTAAQNLSLQCNFAPTELKYIKFLATPVRKLPDWHAGKGEKGWVFMDEVFVN
jgi:uncharacterized membrane protein